MSLREAWPCVVGGQNVLAGLLTRGRHLLQGTGRCWFCLGSPQFKVCLRKGGVCFGETRAAFVCFPGVFPESGGVG